VRRLYLLGDNIKKEEVIEVKSLKIRSEAFPLVGKGPKVRPGIIIAFQTLFKNWSLIKI
jgi:hypothetical protein